jgi:hypothetical protein
MLKENLQHRSFQHNPQKSIAAEHITPALLPLIAIVEAGHGEWIGLQYVPHDPHNPLVLFNHPFLKTTLALPLHDLTAEAVRQRLREKLHEWARDSRCSY